MKRFDKLDDIIEFYRTTDNFHHLDCALDSWGFLCAAEFEEEVELWKTYGGD